MNSEPQNGPSADEAGPADAAGSSAEKGAVKRLPGLIAIAIYLVLLAGAVILGVVMKVYPLLYLVFPVLFFAAALGLMMLFRWAWAMTLAAVVLLAAISLYQFSTAHAALGLVQGLLNLVFFLYLVRAEVRQKLR